MQNNASIYKVRKLKFWFQKNDTKVMKWFLYNLDLNLIENFWVLLKKKIYKVYLNLNSLKNKENEVKNQLFRILQRVWVNLQEKIMKKLIFSMFHRCAAVNKVKNWHIKYWLRNCNLYTIK